MSSVTIRCVLGCAAIAATGCPKTVANPGDVSLPSVELKVRGADGQYQAASSWSLNAAGGDRADLMCVVRDPDGVKQIRLDFTSMVPHCTTHGGAVYDGTFPVSPVPSEEVQTLQADGSGQVLTSLPLLATVAGPFSCDVPGNGSGAPYGDTITVTCTGLNWSAKPADATAKANLAITIH